MVPAWEVKRPEVGPARRRRLAAFPPFPPEKRTFTRPGKRLLNNYGTSPSLVGNQLYFYGNFQ